MRQENYDNTKELLDRWAEFASVGGRIADGAPKSSPGAPGARINSFEDIEIEVNKRLVDIVDSAVYELPIMERNVILMHYGMMKYQVWKADFTRLFDIAIESVYDLLRKKLPL